MSALLQETSFSSKGSPIEERVSAYLRELRGRAVPFESMEAFEREAHELAMEVEREIVAEGLSRLDIHAKVVEVDGRVYRHVGRGEKSYLGAGGEVRVERSLYRAAPGEQAICPLELRAGIVEGLWTPRAARQGARVVALLPPSEGEGLFREIGNMTPSKSALDRLSRQLGKTWEDSRGESEGTLCAEVVVPEEAVSVAASLDGVMVPMKRPAESASGIPEEPEAPGAEGSTSEGGQVVAEGTPEGDKKPCYKEASCGTISFYDADGQRLDTLRFARMPEPGKAALKSQLAANIDRILDQRPDLTLVKLADGAKDNWRFLGDRLRPGEGREVLDFYHASEHLATAVNAAYGKGSSKSRAQHKKYRTLLKEEVDGVEKVIRAISYLQKKHPRREKLATELAYFRSNRHRMRYTEAREEHLPIGSGVTEAACKTLVSQRLKGAGMRWKIPGGQGVLTIRSLLQSNRFERGWELLAAAYRKAVSMPDNVVPIR